jgi:serine/threonine protein kinase
MSVSPKDDPDSLPLSGERRVDELCRRFEDAWKSGARPRPEDFLGESAGPERLALLRELLRLDVSYRRAHDEEPRPDDYLPRFPELDAAWLTELLHAEMTSTHEATNVSPRRPSPEERSGAVLAGRYKLLERIGEGGMGSVWKAQQTEPVKRTVAVKLIKGGGDSRAVLARFEAERQALALMDHPNIARVLDAGTTERGAPYFVMELVKGVPITKFCDDRKLTPRQRLELFVPVCQALQHAHQKGIIHRDVKPSNVLVALYDDRPVPKVIDFGVAKATIAPLTDATLHTGFGALVGTPQYMSPEQATLNNLDIDTRSDIYSLGVLLYELLAGSPPFNRKELEKAGMLEILRVIREEEPPKPSTRVSTADALPSLAANRGTEPARLSRLLRGEIDWIVMKALDKERSRRYESANGLAMDIQRYLADEPVSASPPSAAYRLRKFVKRHKGRVAAAGLVLLALLLGMAGTTAGLVRARGAEAAAEADARRAREAEKKAAEEEAVAREISDFMRNDVLAQAGPNARANRGATPDANVKMRTVLDRAADGIPGKFSRPLVEAAVRLTIGDAYVELGDYGAARPHLERALELFRRERGPEHPETLHAANSLGRLYLLRADYRKADPLLDKTLAACRSALGGDDRETLAALTNLATLHEARGRFKRAEPLYLEVVETRRRTQGAEHHDTLAALNNLAIVSQRLGNSERAEKLALEALDAKSRVDGPEHPGTLSARLTLAVIFSMQGRHEKALDLAERALELHVKVFGADHPATLTATNDLASAYEAAGKFDRAEPLYVRTLEQRRRVLGEEHPETISSVSNLGLLYFRQDKFDKAAPLIERGLEVGRRVLGEEHPDVLLLMNNMVQLNRVRNRPEEAEKLAATLLKSAEDVLGDEHRLTLTVMNNLASLREARGDLDGAEPLYVRGLELRRRALGADDPDTLSSLNNLGLLYARRDLPAKAEPLLAESLAATARVEGPEHPHTVMIRNNLASVYEMQGKFDKAEPLFEESLKALRPANKLPDPLLLNTTLALARVLHARDRCDVAEPLLADLLEAGRREFGDDDLRTAAIQAQVGLNHLKLRKYVEAESALRACLAVREKMTPQQWNTFNTRSMLGGALLGQKKYGEAEPFVLDGYAGMKKQEKNIPPQGKVRLKEAGERLVDLYEAWGKKDEAAKWRKELDAANKEP